MSVKVFDVEFSGHTRIEFDTDDYPHNEGLHDEDNRRQLALDIFFDEADLRHGPFQDGATEFVTAWVEEWKAR